MDVHIMDSFNFNERVYRCARCGNFCSEDENFCINCGYPLSAPNSPYFGLKCRVDKILEYAELINNNHYDEKLAPMITKLRDMKSINNTLLSDLLVWLCYLGASDGIIADSEVYFINFVLGLSFTQQDIINYITKNNESVYNFYTGEVLAHMVLYENDLYYLETEGTNINSADVLFNLFNDIGLAFIGVDGTVSQSEMDKFNLFMKNWKENIKQFKNFKKEEYDNIFSRTKYSTTNSEENTIKKDNTSIPNNNLKETEDKSLQEYIDELDKLIGLYSVKNDVNSLINLIQVRQVREERGMKQPPMSLHLVFSGNPGTGKTTVARLLAKIYHKMGLLSKGHLIETDRSGLVGGYVGQTAIKTQEVIQNAIGGILFIDEAYTLSSSKGETDYGQESIDTILKAMEDNRDDLIVIVAGYPDLMREFLQSNPGLQSRFNKFIYFEDYDADEMYEIFKSMCDDNNLILEDEADKFVKKYFVELYNNRSNNFANGRDVRNLFERVLSNQADRIASNLDVSDEELSTLKYEDFNKYI